MQCKSDGNMEDVPTEKDCSPHPIVLETQESSDVKTTESAENFQKFMHELFEQNGVMNDLRAYLRGHIVGILRSTRSGEPPPCQKKFMQRLELPYQALNMLLAEYLMRLEFSYTLSVFVSEIPLANMVLDFARSLMQGNQSNTLLKFKDEDVWSILNYLGIKCDSDHASKIVRMYREDTECQSPLLLCMLKCMPLYTPIDVEKDSSHESLSSSVKSSETGAAGSCSRLTASRCKHLVFCKTCQGNMLKIKEKYKKKKKTLTKNMKHSSVMPQNVESLMKNIDVVERNLIDEMFQQLKSVYEAEMQMAKAEEEERVKRSLTNHAVQFKMKRIALEENFKARELELTRNVQQKKRFLWGLARLLRDQHQQMARAMLDVQTETSRLTAKENSLKSQLSEAEAVLRSRGEDMRQQISDELAVLERHLDSIKTERDTINKARTELEQMKNLCDNNEKANNVETTKEDLRSHYDLLKTELNMLKKYLKYAKIEPKVVMERSTITEEDSTRIDGVLNNGQDLDRSKSEDRVKTKRVINDLKKMKNVNFDQSKLAEIFDERAQSSPSRSTESSEQGDTRDMRDIRDMHDARVVARRDGIDVTQLLEENERLRTFARQQREHIDELSSQQARLQAELTVARLSPAPRPSPTPRPRTAPATVPPGSLLQRMSTSSGQGWRKGAGEEMSFFVNAQPRILLPGDTLPFIGLVRDRHNDNRRYLINQWRSLRRRMSPDSGYRERHVDRERPNSAGPSVLLPSEPDDLNDNENQGTILNHAHNYSRDQSNEQTSKSLEKSSVKSRDKSHKCFLREAKERLKSRDNKYQRSDREPSPSTVIRDAKRRLRKLEIEAEAVEQSYLDFRRRRDAKRSERRATTEKAQTSAIDNMKHNLPSLDTDVNRFESTSRYVIQKPTIEIIENIDEFNSKYNIGVTHSKNSNATPVKMRAIPAESSVYKTSKTNLLETSMPEFRKYYHCEKRANEDLIEERPRTSETRNRDLERPRSTFVNLKLADDEHPSSSISRTRKASSEGGGSPMASLSHNVVGRNDPNPLENRDPSPIQDNVDVNRTRSPKIIIKDITKGHRTDVRQSKHPKAKQLKILKENINKIYNLSENTMAEKENYKEAVENAKWEMKQEITDVIEETINEVSRDEINRDPVNKDLGDDKNLLRIEVQSVTQVNDIKVTESQTQDLLLIIESSNVTEPSDTEFPQEIISTQMTILVSPKRSISEKFPEDNGGEKAMGLGDHDLLNSLYQASPNENISSVQMNLDNSKDVLIPFQSDMEINEEDDNSLRYDTDRDRSPVSMAKTSDDENFWDT